MTTRETTRLCEVCGNPTKHPSRATCGYSCSKKGARNGRFIDGRKSDANQWHRIQFERHPDRIRARDLTRKHIAKGAIKKLPCRDCGDPKSEAHHPDYSKPTEVIFLCRTCHTKHHHGN